MERVRIFVRVRKGFGQHRPARRGVGVRSSARILVRRPRVDLRSIEPIGIGRAGRELSDLVRQVEQGRVHYQLMRHDRPAAVLVSYADFLSFVDVARQDALAKALLQGKGYDPRSMTVQEFLDLLADQVKEESNAGG